MFAEHHVALQPFNTLGIAARADRLVRISHPDDVTAVLSDPVLGRWPRLVLGGGSNLVLTGDVSALVLKVEVPGMRLAHETATHWVVEAGGGVSWHALVAWTLQHGLPGLENLALIPGTVGAAPVQNIGAYGVELQDRFDSLDAIDLRTGQLFTLNAAQCAFGYRDSVFKHPPVKGGSGGPGAVGYGLAGQALIVRVRLALPKQWRPELGYLELARKQQESGLAHPDAQMIFDWVCAIRRAKLPDPAVIGNAGSFFKNPTVTAEQCADIIGREPRVVHYPLADGRIKLAAGWLIDACGWKGKSLGQAGVYEKQALVLVNRGNATGGEVMTLAGAIQTSVYERFGIRLEPEPVVV
jgi:UDP-N-acetylmuramate dehydrogenase